MFLPYEEKLLGYVLNSELAGYFSKISYTIYPLIFLYFVVIWKLRKENSARLHYMFALAFTTLLAFLIKHSTQVLRPFEVEKLAMSVSKVIGSSFPSAHATIAFFCVSVIAEMFREKRHLAGGLYLWAILISLSRFFAGLHYITDLMGGFILGYSLGRFSWRYENEIINFHKYLIYNIEGRRKIIHTLLGFSFAVLIYFGPYREVVLFIFSLAVVSFIVSVMFKLGKSPALISRIIHYLEREEEKNEFPAQGAFFFFLSSTIVAFFFPVKIAAAALTALALGDGFATLIGRKYGKRKYRHNIRKSLEGSIAGFVACLIGSMLFVNLWLSVLNSVVFVIIESIHLEARARKINDNLYIPVACAIVLSLAQSL